MSPDRLATFNTRKGVPSTSMPTQTVPGIVRDHEEMQALGEAAQGFVEDLKSIDPNARSALRTGTLNRLARGVLGVADDSPGFINGAAQLKLDLE